jgi:hypothetical protein
MARSEEEIERIQAEDKVEMTKKIKVVDDFIKQHPEMNVTFHEYDAVLRYYSTGLADVLLDAGAPLSVMAEVASKDIVAYRILFAVGFMSGWEASKADSILKKV